ncbi:Capsular polysaccharide biosynthesis protein [Flavobacterium daejeonense]|nr:Capsular polysaccharide biosynthesis protein [Flavobacterium daejeonense]
MFSFFKSKAVLKDLIPDNHIDIHSHLLPGIDDGAKTFEDSLRLTKALDKIGIKKFITTPHITESFWDNTTEKIIANQNHTVKALAEKGFSTPFKAAAEFMIDEQFVRLFQTQPLLTLKDNYVLVEISYSNAPIQLYSILFDLRVAGYTPVLAHPERYLFYHKNTAEYDKLKKAGCLFQLNLLAVTGYYGENIAKVAESLLQKGLYDFVGSDVHHDRHIAAFDDKIKLKDLNPLKEVIGNNQFFKG